MTTSIGILKDALVQYGFTESHHPLVHYVSYMERVLIKNEMMNLTSITDPKAFVYKHFIDSLSILKSMDLKSHHKVIDIGTGAGFPGIPLKLYTDCEMTLLDALNKRIRFIEESVSDYGFSRFEALHGRAEELAQKPMYRAQYDFVVSRAVAHLRILSELSIPFLKKGGFFIALKGPQFGEELEATQSALKKLGAEIHRIDTFTMKELDLNHTLVIIRKLKDTDKRYPRKFSIIQQKHI